MRTTSNTSLREKKPENIIPLANTTLSVRPGYENETGVKSKTKETEKSLISKLTKRQTDALYRMYQLDFEMFGYDVNQYSK